MHEVSVEKVWVEGEEESLGQSSEDTSTEGHQGCGRARKEVGGSWDSSRGCRATPVDIWDSDKDFSLLDSSTA